MLQPCPSRRSPHSSLRLLRVAASAAVLALLSACASQGPTVSAPQQAAVYVSHARNDYVPPGPQGDPWGPYIEEASAKFDVPEPWIRALMHVESGGQEYRGGQLITSGAGAMGLMQVMPGTYEELRGRYALGDDPFDPRDNITAGVAYMRELYDIYGAPAFLAAYNGGPARLDDYLADLRPLPAETRHYVAMIAPSLEGVSPREPSPAEAYAMNAMPIDIAPGLRYGGGPVMLASARHVTEHHRWARHEFARREPSRHETRYARLMQSRSERHGGVTRVALYLPPPPPPDFGRHGSRPHEGFHLIGRAEAAPIPTHFAGTGWGIQVGAYTSQAQARRAAGAAGPDAHGSHEKIASVHDRHGLLYRARLVGLSKSAALHACEKLQHGHSGCMVISPAARS